MTSALFIQQKLMPQNPFAEERTPFPWAFPGPALSLCGLGFTSELLRNADSGLFLRGGGRSEALVLRRPVAPAGPES